MAVEESAEQAWESLGGAWHAAFEQAWLAWCGGNFGIGAVLVDPTQHVADGSPKVIAAGRNRVGEAPSEPGVIAGNFMAHAEMNVFAAMPTFNASGLHLYTTLEPCLMCSATSVLLRVGHVHFAVNDEFFAGVHELWQQHPYSAERRPERTGPLTGKIASFARVLPLSWLMLFRGDNQAANYALENQPVLSALAISLTADDRLSQYKGESVQAALRELWPDLPDEIS